MDPSEKAKNLVNIWDLAQKEEVTHVENKPSETTVIIVGESNSGKSCLISLLKGTLKDEAPKPTSAMEYSFARRNLESKREVSHIYELGGGRLLRSLVSVSLNKENIKDGLFIIMVDLSQPGSVLDSLIFWFDAIREHLEKTLQQAFKKNQAEINQYKQEYLRQFEKCEDRSKINPICVKTIVFAHKYDLFESLEVENRKWMSKILRYMCHVNGASLFCSSVVNPKLSNQVKGLLSSCFFGGEIQPLLQRDHMKPVFITAGSDTIDSLGLTASGNMAPIDILKKISKDYFPQASKNNDLLENFTAELSKYSETKIDNTKVEKEKELNRLMRQFNIAKEEAPRLQENERELVISNDRDEDFEDSFGYKSTLLQDNQPVTKQTATSRNQPPVQAGTRSTGRDGMPNNSAVGAKSQGLPSLGSAAGIGGEEARGMKTTFRPKMTKN